MPTAKKRINVTVSDELEKMIEKLAKKDDVPVATKANELLTIATEIHEDDVWNELAEKRDTKKAKYLSHEEAWS